ncbi:MAG: efflux RND transporter permease subunit [Bacteroidetes bacterium]|nr:efflux RND transporter permease subunit [Bacteroidota bacterium]
MKQFISFIISFSLKKRGFILFVTLLLVVAGVISYQNTPVEAFPDVTNTQITIITQWPGRSAEEIEKFVTIPLEIALNPVAKKTSLRSTTLFGLSVVKIIFEDDVDDTYARQQVNNLIGGADLPDGVDPDIQPPYGPTGEIYRYTIESKNRTPRDLKTIQDWIIERNLKSVQGVADVVSFGGEVKSYEVSLDKNALDEYDLTPLDVYEAINKSNINVGGDVIEKNSQAYVVRGLGLLSSITDIENIIVNYKDGVPVCVKNIATVFESALPRLGQVGRDTTNNVVEGIVVMRKGENPGQVIDAVNKKIEELNYKVLPNDVKIVPFYNRQNLINFCTHTVSHNLLEGILLVTTIVLLFMANWRTTVIVSIIIPLALLFAFMCLRLKGMNANLLSMGAIDFGIIIDGAVVMVEGLFVLLDKQAHKIGMENFNRRSKRGLVKITAVELGKAIFFSKLIIITCLLPIFSFQKVEGKMFSPLAYTLGFALLGALLYTLTLVPVLVTYFLNKNVREKHNVFVEAIQNGVMRAFRFCFDRRKAALIVASVVVLGGFASFKFLGTEFLPELNEGSIYVRANLPLSISLNEAVKLSTEMRKVFGKYPEVKQVLSQTGRPNDGTDPTGFYNVEFFVDLYPKDEWKSGLTKDELIDKMQKELKKYPGIDFNFSQPIMDNVEEAVSGVKGSLAVKIFGDDLPYIETQAEKVYEILKHVEGVEDLGIIKNIGQPELRIELNRARMTAFGINTADCNSVIEMAIGGKAATQFYEGNRKFDVRIRFNRQFRMSEREIGKIRVPTMSGTNIPLKEIAKIYSVTGPLLIFRDDNKRFIAVKFSVRGRDMGSTIGEAQLKVDKEVKLRKGTSMTWNGDFENQQRASKRLSIVVPISLVLIFLILFILFGNARDSLLVLANVPFAIIGGIWALMVTHMNFSISAGIGFIALFGICIQNGVILISVFKQNLKEKLPLTKAIFDGVLSRVRPVIMTALMAAIGLMPAALSTGIGSETSKPLAIVIIGGLITATILTLLIFPIIYYAFYRKKF